MATASPAPMVKSPRKKNVLIWLFDGENGNGHQRMQIYLGEGYDFGERSANMPKFDASYRHSGAAKCKAR